TLELDKLISSLDDEMRTNIIILDACRDNPLARSLAAKVQSGSASIGLAAVSNVNNGTLVAYAAAPGTVTTDADSPYTPALVRQLRTPGLDLSRILRQVRAEVADATRRNQIPWQNSSLLGEVYLAGGKR